MQEVILSKEACLKPQRYIGIFLFFAYFMYCHIGMKASPLKSYLLFITKLVFDTGTIYSSFFV